MHKTPVLCPLPLCAVVLALAVALSGCSRQPEQAAGQPAGTNTPTLIVPHISVGSIRVGMTVQQLVAQVGDPRNKTAKAYDYPQLGLAVMPRDGAVFAVMCGDVTGINGAYVKVFNGRTREGIGLRSTREEVLTAYGPPTEIQGKPGALESLKYVNLGMTFNLEGGKVHHMIIVLDGKEGAATAESEATNAMKLNLGPPPGQTTE